MLTKLWLSLACLLLMAIASGCTCVETGAHAVEAPLRYACRGGVIRDDAGVSAKAGCLRVVGDLTIVNVESLALLDALQRVDGTLTVRDTRATSLQGLQGLRSVRGLSIWNNPVLRDVSALKGLAQARFVHLHGNRELGSPRGLESLGELDELVIQRSGFMTLDGLDGLRRVGRLELRDNPKLVSMAALNRLRDAQEVKLEKNPLVCGKLGVLKGLAVPPTTLLAVQNGALEDKDIEHLHPLWEELGLVLQ
jgi:hypothetical protein